MCWHPGADLRPRAGEEGGGGGVRSLDRGCACGAHALRVIGNRCSAGEDASVYCVCGGRERQRLPSFRDRGAEVRTPRSERWWWQDVGEGVMGVCVGRSSHRIYIKPRLTSNHKPDKKGGDACGLPVGNGDPSLPALNGLLWSRRRSASR